MPYLFLKVHMNGPLTYVNASVLESTDDVHSTMLNVQMPRRLSKRHNSPTPSCPDHQLDPSLVTVLPTLFRKNIQSISVIFIYQELTAHVSSVHVKLSRMNVSDIQRLKFYD